VRAPGEFLFRPTSAYVLGGTWALVTAVWLGLAAATDGPVGLLRQLPPAVFAAATVVVVLVRPSVRVDADGVLVRNPLRDVTVPWGALGELSTQYVLTLTCRSGRRVQAWAAPAGSRIGAARVTDRDVQALGWRPGDGPIAASATIRSDSGAAAVAVRRGWQRYLADGARDGGAAIPTETVRWSVPVLVVEAVALVAAALSLLLR
jgi:hypothetical protein